MEKKPHKDDEATDEDKEWNDIKKKTPGLEEDTEEPSKDDESEEEESDDDESKEKKPTKEEKSKSSKEDKDESEDDDEEEDESEEEDDEEEDSIPRRPEKYIPIKQYTDEKRENKEKIEKLEKQLKDALGGKSKVLSDDKVKKYAEKHDLDVDAARSELERLQDALELAKEDDAGDDKKPPEMDDDTKARLEEADVIKAEKLFNEDFDNSAMPEIKELYPDATPKQLKEAKKAIEKIACTKEFLNSSLDYVVYKSQKELGKIFDTRKGPESTRVAPKHGKEEYTANDFKDGKTSFDVLATLSSEEQTKIVEGMDVKTYDKYSRFIDQSDSININRGGKKVSS